MAGFECGTVVGPGGGLGWLGWAFSCRLDPNEGYPPTGHRSFAGPLGGILLRLHLPDTAAFLLTSLEGTLFPWPSGHMTSRACTRV